MTQPSKGKWHGAPKGDAPPRFGIATISCLGTLGQFAGALQQISLDPTTIDTCKIDTQFNRNLSICMDAIRDLTDDAFLEAFLACRLPAKAFHHRNHLRVAWIHLQRLPIDEAIEQTCAGIARYAAHLDASHRYHRTLTEALVRLMAHAGGADRSLAFEGFLAQAPAFLGDCRIMVAEHYSPELLARPDARYDFLSPDRLPLPS